MALLAAVAVLVHIPSFVRPFWNPDEGYLATEARMLAHGGTLYVDVVDRKPPLLPWLYQGAFAVFGSDSLWPLRVLAIFACFVTALFVASVARRRWGGSAGTVAGLFTILLSVALAPEDTQAATFEVFMLPATAAAFWCADRHRWTGAGLATALAAMVKQTGGVVLLPALYLLWRHDRSPRAAARLLLAAALPVLALALLTGPRNFLFWVVSGSGDYTSLDGAWATALGRAAGNAGIMLAALVPAVILLARRLRVSLREDADLWIWLGGSAVGVAVGFHFFGHYYLQLVPALALLCAGALHRVAEPRWARLALGWAAVAAAVFVTLGLTASTQPVGRVQAVARAIDARSTPDQRVLVWGMHPEIYWLADRAPASRYLTAGLLTNFAGGRDGRGVSVQKAVAGSWTTFEHEMLAAPPTLVVDDSQGAPYAPAAVPPIRTLLAARYERVGTAGGAVIYRLRGR
ncbi:glycosyltransferase [Streptacidiphilus pinicola]|uniref:Glycosyltransferase n=1 Tax=Streptacidiphilus pinicola TaxID=2219663 RepID=A0A2X0IP48_9ACTN|nr:glycosyltransferase family 39 protein [Streptacidiphilus pinicola]RAG86407.1 glycosyltransferase [Streptacidiphilus pinicola]